MYGRQIFSFAARVKKMFRFFSSGKSKAVPVRSITFNYKIIFSLFFWIFPFNIFYK